MQKEDFADLYALEEKFWWFAGMREISASVLDDFCDGGKNFKVLDAGCGTGLNLEWLRRYASEENIFGLDYSSDAIDFCRERKLKNLVQASATDLPFADEYFDLVASFDVLVQLFDDGDEKAINEMYRVLKPNGVIFVRGAAYKWMRSGHDIAVNSQRRYTLNELKSKIETAGFTVLRSTYANTLLFPAAVIRRHIMKPLGIGETGSDVKPLPPNMDWLNSFFTKNMLAEARFLKNQKRALPFGLSAICIARKNS